VTSIRTNPAYAATALFSSNPTWTQEHLSVIIAATVMSSDGSTEMKIDSFIGE
jgi:hypothetical protein